MSDDLDKWPTDDLVATLLQSFMGSIMFTFYTVSAYGLYKHLSFKYYYAFLKPSKAMKCTAMISMCSYVISYGTLMVASIILIIGEETSLIKDEGGPIAALVVWLLLALSFFSALICYHFYILNRINHHINTYNDIMPMPLYYKCKIYYIVVVLIIILIIDWCIFGICRSGFFDYGDTVTDWSLFAELMALSLELCISLLLLVIYVWSFHVLSMYYAQRDYNNQLDDRQHEHMLRASRFTVVCGISIIASIIFYSFGAFAYYLDIQNRIYYTLYLGILVIIKDISTGCALCFGFEFGHDSYMKYCGWCHKKIYHLNENIAKSRTENAQKRHVEDEKLKSIQICHDDQYILMEDVED